MCTITFMPRSKGYCLGMNRDEKQTRAKSLPPATRSMNGRQVLYPSEPTGGTWIALNDKGVSFALINWFSVSAEAEGNIVSRGVIIPSLSATDSSSFANACLAALPLERINPFRLIGVFPVSQAITEWRWDLKHLTRRPHRWRAQQWISSGFDEPTAQRIRSKTFRQAQTQQSAGTIGWLRHLHRSHTPHAGPFSTCMHRDDAITVSYTEIVVSRGKSKMRYHDGPPCHGAVTSRLSQYTPISPTPSPSTP